MQHDRIGVRVRLVAVAIVMTTTVAVLAPHAWARDISPLGAGAALQMKVGAVPLTGLGTPMPSASAAQDPTYTVPPTNVGLLGISKNSWGKASDVANGVAAVAAGVAVWGAAVGAGAAVPTLGVSAAAGGTVMLVAGGISAGAWLAGSVFSYLSRDPLDRNFKSIFKPVLATLPPIGLSLTQSAAVSSALHALLQSELRLTELATAFVTSVNRVHGARAARNATWVLRQERAAAQYARQAAKLLLGFERERDAIESALVAAGVDVTVSAQAIAAGQSRLAAHGLPPTLTNQLKSLTKGSVAASLKRRILDFNAFKKQLTSRTPQAVTFPGPLAQPSEALEEARVAGALTGYANSVP